MAFFKDILSKLGFKTKEEKAAASTTTTTTAGAKIGNLLGNLTAAAKSSAAAPMEMVDVVAKLDGLAKANPEKLDWKVSIVDLLKLLGIDSSLTSRKELATELGCPADLMGGDYAKMNVWLHQAVLQKIAANGGNVPASLLK
jgi:hypothetical protein